MRFKCVKCKQFVPVSWDAYRYCGWCGSPLDRRVERLLERTDEAQERSRRTEGRIGTVTILGVVGCTAVTRSWDNWFIPAIGCMLFIVGYLIARPILKRRIRRQYPDVYFDAGWEP